LKPDATQQAAELEAVSAAVGAILTTDNLILPGLRFTSAFMLAYGGSPMGLIAYVEGSGTPVLLCILPNGVKNMRTDSERRGDLWLAWWAGHGAAI
jgi:hypothetical protein